VVRVDPVVARGSGHEQGGVGLQRFRRIDLVVRRVVLQEGPVVGLVLQYAQKWVCEEVSSADIIRAH